MQKIVDFLLRQKFLACALFYASPFRTAKSGKCCCNGGKIPRQCLIGTVVLSVIVFIFTGASLLITKGTGQIFSS